MPYNPQLFYPQGYQTVFPQPNMQAAPMPVSNPAPQMMSPPTIHAEIVQVDGEQAAAAFPVGAGSSQMMMARDDSAIYIKSATANGFTLEVYERRVRTAQDAPFDPREYVRRDELESLVIATLGAQKRGKREAVDDEPV